MRQKTLTSVAFLLLCVASASAQDTPTAADFRASEIAQKRGMLLQIFLHEKAARPEDIADVIRAGIKDEDPTIREAALAVIVSRAAGPHMLRTPAIRDDWRNDRQALQALRPQVAEALQDQVEAVRVEAVTALASLDFDPAQSDLELSFTTVELLVRHFYADSSPKVRAKIVGGFSTDRTVNSAGVRRLLIDAFDDDDHRVRHAASFGADRLGRDGIPLLVRLLRDSQRAVRSQAALMLTKLGPEASDYLSQVEEAIAQERDAVVRQRIQTAITAIRKQK